MKKAKISDIFFSVQGEGIYAGTPQVFVRFWGCQCRCGFCDTSLAAYDKYSSLELYRRIKDFPANFHSLCLTGGEPLLQHEFLREFLRLVKYAGITTYLETNGILTEPLRESIQDLDIIAMDFKLPSSTGDRPYWAEHEQFLQVALKKDVFIKMVICAKTEKEDLDQAIDLMLRLKVKKIPVVLQPNFFELSKELLAKISAWRKYFTQHLDAVWVIPQLHKLIGAR